MRLTTKKAAKMSQSELDQSLTRFVENGLEDSADYVVLLAEHDSRSKERQEAMTAAEFGGGAVVEVAPRKSTANQAPEVFSTMSEVLVFHQRMTPGSCLCGFSKIGHSHPVHQQEMLIAAGFGSKRDSWQEGWDHYRDIPFPAASGFGINPYVTTA